MVIQKHPYNNKAFSMLKWMDIFSHSIRIAWLSIYYIFLCHTPWLRTPAEHWLCSALLILILWFMNLSCINLRLGSICSSVISAAVWAYQSQCPVQSCAPRPPKEAPIIGPVSQPPVITQPDWVKVQELFRTS